MQNFFRGSAGFRRKNRNAGPTKNPAPGQCTCTAPEREIYLLFTAPQNDSAACRGSSCRTQRLPRDSGRCTPCSGCSCRPRRALPFRSVMLFVGQSLAHIGRSRCRPSPAVKALCFDEARIEERIHRAAHQAVVEVVAGSAGTRRPSPRGRQSRGQCPAPPSRRSCRASSACGDAEHGDIVFRHDDLRRAHAGKPLHAAELTVITMRRCRSRRRRS